MLVLIGIGFAAGLVTAISPCVLPVLPIVLAGGATGGRRKPFAIIAGLVAQLHASSRSFGVWLLDTLGLPRGPPAQPRDRAALRRRGDAALPAGRRAASSGRSLRLTRRPSGDLGGGFLLGASLGLVFVPCAGPVLAAITVARGDAATSASARSCSRSPTRSAPPCRCCSIALGGRSGVDRGSARTRERVRQRRSASSSALTALAIAFNVDRHFQTALPGYTQALQKHVEEQLDARSGSCTKLRGDGTRASVAATTALPDYGAGAAASPGSTRLDQHASR